MKIIELGENPRENGKLIGRAFYSFLNQTKHEFEEKLNDTQVYSDVKEARIIMENNMPEMLEELYGKAEASGIRKEVILLMAMPEILRRKSGCTTIMRRNGNGTISFSHNEDEWHSEFNNESTALLKYRYGDRTIYGYTSAYKTIGSCFGFRSDGLLISCNHLTSDALNLHYLSRYVLSAKLYFSSSYDEAVEIAKYMKPASPFHVNLCDTRTNRACSIERDLDDCILTELDDVLVHSNHFLHKEGKSSENSRFRYEKTCELLKASDDLRGILSYTSEDHDHTIRMTDPFDKGEAITAANMTYDPVSDLILIKDENDGSELSFLLSEI